jgi:hypothetical protein
MKVMFATPCYISAVSMHYVTSIFELTHHCNRFGLQCILHMHSESLITRSRNKMVLKFLSDADDRYLGRQLSGLHQARINPHLAASQ